MAEDSEDKTEEPSGRKLDEARERGQLGRSMDLNSAMVLLAGVSALAVFGAQFTKQCAGLMHEYFGSISHVGEPTDTWFVFLCSHVLKASLDLLWPILLVLLVVGLSVNLLQVGLNFTTKPLEMNISKVFNMKVLTNMFATQAWVELLKGLAKMTVIGYVAYDCIQSRFDDILSSIDLDITGLVGLLIEIAFNMLWKVVLLLLILGFVDWIYQKRKTHNELKMTKQEVKEETKNTQGDPKMIAARKRVMYKMHQQFMMKDVPKATVVITNPTHLAIAIRYQRGTDQAPMVVAKGKQLVAERIRELAREAGVPIVENKPLARQMFDQVQVGDVIPQEFFHAVAEVLAYVFSMDKRKAAFR